MTEQGGVWSALERRMTMAFVLGGLLLFVDAGYLAANAATGEESYLIQGQAFLAGGWAVALLGLLGLYPVLSTRSRWLSRAGAVSAVIGGVNYTVMAFAIVGFEAGLLGEAFFDAIGVLFIPGVIIGSVLGFGLFGVISLKSDAYVRSVGVLLLLAPALVLANFVRFAAGMTDPMGTLVIVIGDAIAMLTIGYILRG